MCCGGSDSEEGPEVRPQGDKPSTPAVPIPVNPSSPGAPPPMNLTDGGDPASSGGPIPGPSAGPSFPVTPVTGGRRRIRRLYCKTGYDLAVFPNGKVQGIKSSRNKYGNLEFESAGLNGEIRIKGVETGLYVTMTPKGRVMGQPEANHRGTVWVETKIATGTTYMSLLSLDYAHHGYYLALKKSGKPKAGPKTHHPYPQKAISFLPRIVSEE